MQRNTSHALTAEEAQETKIKLQLRFNMALIERLGCRAASASRSLSTSSKNCCITCSWFLVVQSRWLTLPSLISSAVTRSSNLEDTIRSPNNRTRFSSVVKRWSWLVSTSTIAVKITVWASAAGAADPATTPLLRHCCSWLRAEGAFWAIAASKRNLIETINITTAEPAQANSSHIWKVGRNWWNDTSKPTTVL